MESTEQSITLSAQPFSLCFHPTIPSIVAVGLITGSIEIHDLKLNDPNSPLYASSSSLANKSRTATTHPFKGHSSTRTISYSPTTTGITSNLIYATSSTGTFTGLNNTSLSPTFVVYEAHGRHPPHKKGVAVNEYTLTGPIGISAFVQIGEFCVTGDDIGGIRFWDMRGIPNGESSIVRDKVPKGCIGSFSNNLDYISGFLVSDDGGTLLVTSGDATLSAYDIKNLSKPFKVNKNQNQKDTSTVNAKLLKQSDDVEDELLSLCVLKNGSKVICGTSSGALCIWSWGKWADMSTRFPGHPQSIDCILKLDESTLLTGSSDGLIRVVQIMPDRLIGVFGDHGGFPVERMAFSCDRSYIGSLSHDDVLRIWDGSVFNDGDGNEEGGGAEEAGDDMDEVEVMKGTHTQQGEGEEGGEWEDLSDDSDDMEDSEEESEEEVEEKNKKGKKKEANYKGFKSENEKFFEDFS